MSRPKSYDRQEAVERACQAFWAHGYTALGVRALEQMTGLNKFAIRTEFSGKEGLYLEALRLYAERAAQFAVEPLKAGGLDQVEEFFQGLVGGSSPMSSRFGCLMVNTGIENAELKSPALEEVSTVYWSMLYRAFEAALQTGREDGALKRDLDLAEAAQGLVTAVMGIHTMNRVSGRDDGGAALVGLIRDLLASWRT